MRRRTRRPSRATTGRSSTSSADYNSTDVRSYSSTGQGIWVIDDPPDDPTYEESLCLPKLIKPVGPSSGSTGPDRSLGTIIEEPKIVPPRRLGAGDWYDGQSTSASLPGGDGTVLVRPIASALGVPQRSGYQESHRLVREMPRTRKKTRDFKSLDEILNEIERDRRAKPSRPDKKPSETSIESIGLQIYKAASSSGTGPSRRSSRRPGSPAASDPPSLSGYGGERIRSWLSKVASPPPSGACISPTPTVISTPSSQSSTTSRATSQHLGQITNVPSPSGAIVTSLRRRHTDQSTSRTAPLVRARHHSRRPRDSVSSASVPVITSKQREVDQATRSTERSPIRTMHPIWLPCRSISKISTTSGVISRLDQHQRMQDRVKG